MHGDKLAQGAKSAQFSGGRAAVDDPIEFHGTVAAEETQEERDVYEDYLKRNPPVAAVELKTLEELASLYAPMNDRVLLRRVTEKNHSLVDLPEAYKLDSDLGVVIAVGDYMIVGGEARPIPLKLGDKVRVGHYNIEDIDCEGEQLMLVSAYDVRLKIKA
jgi:co-chaperonin GroES (HSP10)